MGVINDVDDLSELIAEISNSVSNAVYDIIKDIKFNKRISISEIDIPILNVSELGENANRFTVGKPYIGVNIKV